MAFTPKQEIIDFITTRVNQHLSGVSLAKRQLVINFFVEVATSAHNLVVDDVLREIGVGPSGDPEAYAYAMALKAEVETWRWEIAP